MVVYSSMYSDKVVVLTHGIISTYVQCNKLYHHCTWTKRLRQFSQTNAFEQTIEFWI